MKQIIFHIKKTLRRTKWTKEEDEILISLTNPTGRNSWSTIAQHLPGKSSYTCFLRYRSIKPGLKKGAWTEEEDKRILQGLSEFNPKEWSNIAKYYFTNRTAKQIRDRYINYLDPRIKKGPFSDREDAMIAKMYQVYGAKWTTIQKHLPLRSADSIKNRFNSSIKRSKKFTSEVINNLISFEKVTSTFNSRNV
jgi:hypothetical protein